MIYNLILAFILILSFILCVAAYCLGVKHGRTVIKGDIPHINANPVKIVEQIAEKAKEEKSAQVIEDALSGFDKESMLKAIAKEREERIEGRG